jgi:hypothetical protein
MKPARIIITIAGMPLCFVVRSARMSQRLRKRYAGWTDAKLCPLAVFDCSFVAGAAGGGSSMPRVGPSTMEQGYITRGDFDCRWSMARGRIRCRASIYSFDACLRVLLCTLLPHRGSLLLHASAVVARNNKGFVFVGRSGSGKTTIARMLQGGFPVLNDEICAVRPAGKSGVMVTGTPFWGEMRTGRAHPEMFHLSMLYFLKKGRSTARVRLERGEAFRRLLAGVCHFSKMAGATETLLDVAARIARSVPAYELFFTRVAKEVVAVALYGEECREA